jgi:DNA mismatch repair protein MutL
LDRVLAFPELSFRFNQDGRMRDFFPPAPERERFAALALKNGEAVFLHEVRAAGQGFGIYAVIGGPELYRNDRRQQYVFTNRRRIYDYSILQALEYGLQGWFPNGTHPVGAVYITIEPGLADFNIHPAKREVRFDDPGAIHRILSGALRSFVQSHEKARGSGTALYAGVSSGEGGPGNLFAAEDPGTGYAGGKTEGSALAMEALMENAPSFRPLPGRNGEKPRYAGRVFGLFILVEKGDRLFVIDQHAAHERILYNRFLSGPIAAQELLVPIPFETESAGDDSFLDAEKTRLALLGIILERDGAAWRLKALPQGWKLGDRETIREILALREAGDNIAERWAASLACHGAVRDGDYLDEESALALAEEALKLPEPRCPHGRPLWMELSRENLFKAVRRT